jgi:hypothetical protein
MTITVKLHQQQAAELLAVARARRLSKSELVRRSLAEFLVKNPAPAEAKRRPTVHDRLKKYIPAGGPRVSDLSHNPKHLEGFGEE